MKEGFGKAEGAPVANAPSQDPTQDVIAVAVAGKNTVRNGEAKGSQVISDDAESNVDFLLLVGRFAVCGEGGSVGFSRELAEFGKDGGKDVGIVIGYGF